MGVAGPQRLDLGVGLIWSAVGASLGRTRSATASASATPTMTASRRVRHEDADSGRDMAASRDVRRACYKVAFMLGSQRYAVNGSRSRSPRTDPGGAGDGAGG